MQNAVTSTMKRSSLEKQRSNSVTFTPTPSRSGFSLHPLSGSLPRRQLEVDSTSGNSDDKTESENKVSQDEDAFRKGFEEGLKAKLSQELTELRDHQNSISQSLDHMMDKVDQSQQEEEELLSRPTRLDTIINYSARLKDFLVQHNWRTNKKAIRNLAGLFFVFLAILVVFLSPPLNVKHVTNPPQ
ncbi:unnamed protein product [Lymnaea stagnalis]|uniref:Uncharacterized protein n=1 Tax=Lymnaea stagnalis TaxID=6523 RepID=A0AAV2I5I9_LYMST